MEGKGSSAQVVPVDDLQLEWVHGYSGQSMRGNARYSSTGEVVYPAASFGLVLDKTPVAERMVRSQKVMNTHSSQITALTTHGDLCATSANASVLVWSADAQICKAVAPQWLFRISLLAGRQVPAAARQTPSTRYILACHEPGLSRRLNDQDKILDLRLQGLHNVGVWCFSIFQCLHAGRVAPEGEKRFIWRYKRRAVFFANCGREEENASSARKAVVSTP